MKKRVRLLILPLGLLVVLALGLSLAACGSSGTTTTTIAATTTTSLATTTTMAAVGEQTLTVKLTGAQEVPPVQTSASGVLTLTVTMPATGSTSTSAGAALSGLTVSYKLDVTNITDATEANIELGAPGEKGEVVASLFTGPEKTGTFTGTLAQGTITQADLASPYTEMTSSEFLTAVLSGQTYANVYTAAHHDDSGEIRGQIIISTTGANTVPRRLLGAAISPGGLELTSLH